MKAIVNQLIEKDDKINQENYERIYNLYQAKKSQVTLDGKKRVIISRLCSRFPVVSVAGSGHGIEFSSKTVERILNTTCKFKS